MKHWRRNKVTVTKQLQSNEAKIGDNRDHNIQNNLILNFLILIINQLI